MKETIEKVISSAKAEEREDGHPHFDDKRYIAYPLNIGNFRLIEDITSNKKIAFIDGGNAEIFSSSNMCIGFVRVYCSVFKENRKIGSEKTEFYVVVKTAIEKETMFSADIFPLSDGMIIPDEKDLSFSINDATLRNGIFSYDITKIIEISRRFAEWKMASHALEKADYVVKDGSLQTGVTNESRYRNECYEKAERSGKVICGLAKKSSLFTTTGKNLLSVLNKLSSLEKWYYHPIADIANPDHRAELLAVKLNKYSRFAFRFEVQKGFKNFSEILSLLSEQSNDYRFPGYPYGLIDAHNFAKIGMNEKEYHTTMLAVAKEKAHDVLDNISR